MTCTARIQAGVCGFATNVAAQSADDQMVSLDIQTDCEKIRALAASLDGKTIDAYDEIAKGFDGVILTAARAALSGCCAGCAVPPGIFKSLQVAARLALARDLSITLTAE